MSIDSGFHLAKALVILGLISGYGCGLCNEEIRKQVHSPDGNTTAVYYIRDCGATTNFANLVSLRTSSQKFEGGDADGIVMDAQGRQEIEIHWEGNNTLVVQCPSCKAAQVLSKKTKWKQVAIVYADEENSSTVEPRRQD